MEKLEFTDLLRLIDERSAAFRATVASASSLDITVPSCPEWTLLDLARHIGEGRQSWAATVAAGPGATEKAAPDGPPFPADLAGLDAWLAASTKRLVDALTEAGPDRGAYGRWADGQAPLNCHSVARRQVQELAVHTYDAHLAVGDPRPLPDEVALDGLEDFLFTAVSTATPWPHEPATLEYRTTEGPRWRVRFDGDGARATRLTGDETLAPAETSVEGTASDLVLWGFGRNDGGTITIDGDRSVVDNLIAWEP